MGILDALLGGPATVQGLKHRPGRRRTFRAAGPRGKAIVKVYASGRAPDAAARIALLKDGPAVPIVPEVVLVVPELHMLVLSDVPGVPLSSAALRGELATCARAGAALGGWHGFWSGRAPTGLGEHRIDRELEILRSAAEGAPTRIGRRVLASLDSLDGEWPISTVVHRDLYEEHILVGDSIGLIDLDDASRGPPELDMGNLLAHLELLALRHGTDHRAVEGALLEGYTSAGPVLDRELLQRCRRLALLRLACLHVSEHLVTRAQVVPVDGPHPADGPAGAARAESE